MTLPVIITMGEPAGSGTDILLKTVAQHASVLPPMVVLDDPARLKAASAHLGLSVNIQPIHHIAEVSAPTPGVLSVLPLTHPVPYAPGQATPETAAAVLEALDTAIQLTMTGLASAMVTLPIQKNILYQAGFEHAGHTEYLAAKSNTRRAVMMLATTGLRVVPVTIHTPLAEVARTISHDLILETAQIVLADLHKWFGINTPAVAVAALNPHAGEEGTIGREEIDIIQPACAALKTWGHHVHGPLPADTLFHEEARQAYDAILCMYHDQALIPLKTLDFWGGVNITLGLPFIRTSPDHGTALSLAGTGTARPDSFIAAVQQAWQMKETSHHHHYHHPDP